MTYLRDAPCPPAVPHAGCDPVVRDRDEDWWVRAACRGTDAPEFFPEDYRPGPEREAALAAARQACAPCPVRRRCLEHAIAFHEPKGVWGGLTAAERITFVQHRVPA